MDISKWSLAALLAAFLVGCSSIQEKRNAAESEAYVQSLERSLMVETNTIPVPPGVAPQTNIIKRQSIRALAVTIPDKWIVVRWNQDPDPSITYALDWHRYDEWTMAPSSYHYDTTSTKVDIVRLFKDQGVTPGIYRLTVSAVNGVFIPSDPVTATTLFWFPGQ